MAEQLALPLAGSIYKYGPIMGYSWATYGPLVRAGDWEGSRTLKKSPSVATQTWSAWSAQGASQVQGTSGIPV